MCELSLRSIVVPLGFQNKCTLCECTETTHDVLENLFLDFVTCSSICKMCVLDLHNCNTVSVILRISRAHGNCMSFKISLFFNNFLGILRDISVLHVIDVRKITLSSVGPCLETLSMTLLANVFFFVICRLTWFSLHSEINTRAFCLVTVNTQRVTPCYVHVRSRRVSPQACSMYGCTGSSSVPKELYGRVTSVTCVRLSSKRISVSKFFL